MILLELYPELLSRAKLIVRASLCKDTHGLSKKQKGNSLLLRQKKEPCLGNLHTEIVPETNEKMYVFSVQCLKSKAAKASLREPRALIWPKYTEPVKGGKQSMPAVRFLTTTKLSPSTDTRKVNVA